MVQSPWQWMKLALSRSADFRGRSSRPEFLWFLAGFLGAGYVGGEIVSVFAVNLTSWFAIAVWTVVSVPALAVLVRRLHDLDLSGWWPIPPLLLLGPLGLLLADAPWLQSPSLIELTWLGAMAWLATLPPVMVLSLIWTGRQGNPSPNRYGDVWRQAAAPRARAGRN